MFEFLNDMMNYDQRKVARYDNEDGSIFVSTAQVSDAVKPYETAIVHPEYNNGKHVIVDTYDTKEEAVQAHEKWVKVIIAAELPDELIDVSGAGIATMCDMAAGGDLSWRVHKRQPKS